MIETGNGGDLVFQGGDLSLISEVYNQPYLARFGGNKEASTDDAFNAGDERGDYWGNVLLLSGTPNEQFNSKFEKALNEIELSSSGRIKLERIANEDLNYLESFSEHESTLIIPTVDKVRLKDNIFKGQNKDFSYIWSEAKDEIIDDNASYIN